MKCKRVGEHKLSKHDITKPLNM